MDNSVLYKRWDDWTNEEMDWIEDVHDGNPSSEIRRMLNRKGIPCSVNYTFFISQNKLLWINWEKEYRRAQYYGH